MWRNFPLRRSAIDMFLWPWIMQPCDPDLNIYCMFVPHAQWAHYSEIKYSMFIHAQGAHHFRNKSIVNCVFVTHAQSRHNSDLKRLLVFVVGMVKCWNFSIWPWYVFSYHFTILNIFFLHSWWTRFSFVWRGRVAAGCSWRPEDPSGHGGLARSKDLSRML
jgi:hypothetical protein